MGACVHAHECERTLSCAQRAQTIMTVPRLKCSCNYKFRGAETTMIFATNKFTWFEQNDSGGGAFRAAIGGTRKNAALECQNNISCCVHQTDRTHFALKQNSFN